MTYNGGALIPHVEAQAVFLGSQWTSNTTLEAEAATIDNMLAYTVQSPFMDVLTDAGYNVGQGTATTGARVSTTLTATTTDATIRSLLQSAITLKLVQQPDANRLYVVYMPSGITVNDNGATSQTTFLGYHGAFAGTDVNNVPFDIHYVVVPHPGTPNPTSTSQGFTGAAEVQTLTLGGGTANGSLTPAFGGVFATQSIFRTNEVQKLTFSLSGATTDTVHLLFNGVAGSDATQLTYQAGVSPTAVQVKAHLNTIPALNGNIDVTGSNGGPFTVTYGGALADTDVSAITSSAAGNATLTVAQTNGAIPTAALLQTSLGTIPALTGNVTVTGNNGGPFTITVKNLGNIAPIDVSGVTGGMTASIVTNTDGVTGLTSDLDEMTSVTSHELAEAVTDPDVNYKTLGWYDLTNNVEIGDLTTSLADVPNHNERLGASGYYVQKLFDKTNTVIAADTTSIPLLSTPPSGGASVSTLTGVTATQLSPTQLQISWLPMDAGVVGYRVFQVVGSTQALLGRVPSTARSIIVNVPSLQTVTLKIEAYNAVNVADATITKTITLPAVTAPIITQAQQGSSATSAQLAWQSTIASGAIQTLTMGGTGSGTLKPGFMGLFSSLPLTWTDEQQTVSLGAATGPITFGFNGTTATSTVSATNEVQLVTLSPAGTGTLTPSFLVSGTPVAGTQVSVDNEVQTLNIGAGNGSITLSYDNGSGIGQPASAAAVPVTDEFQTITLGGTDSGSFTPSFMGAASSALNVTDEMQTLTIAAGTGTFTPQLGGSSGTAVSVQNEVQTLTLGSTTTGSFLLSYDGTSATTLLGVTDEVQTISLGGGDGTFSLAYNGASTSDLTVSGGVGPDAATVQAALNLITALNGNVSVTGSTGGPYTVTFNNVLTGVDVSQLTTSVGGATTASVSTTSQAGPTVAQVQSNLDSIPALTGNTQVTGSTGGPFTITFRNGLALTDVTPIAVSNVTSLSPNPTVATVAPGGNPTSAIIQSSLNAIAGLNGNVTVTGNVGGPFTITFKGAKTGQTIDQLTSLTTGTLTVNESTTTDGAAPSSMDLQANLESISALSGNVKVTGAAPKYTVEFINSLARTNVAELTTQVTGGVSATPATTTQGNNPTNTDIQNNLNTIPSLSGNVSVSGNAGGPFTITFINGLARTDVKQLGVSSTGTLAPSTSTQTDGSLRAADLQASLNTIPALSGNVKVTGNTGGPFTITFNGALTGTNVDPLMIATTGSLTVTVSTLTDGSAPTAAAVQASLNTIAALNGNVAVDQASDAGSPYVITITGLGTIPPIDVSNIAPAGGLTATITTASGATGFRVFSVSGSKKTLMVTLPGSATSATITGLPPNKQVSLMVEAFRGSTVADSAAKSVTPTPLAKPTYQGGSVLVTQVAASNALMIQWDSVAGAKGYRVFRLTSTGKKVLVSTLSASTTSTTIAGLSLKTAFIIEAFNGLQVSDSDPTHL